MALSLSFCSLSLCSALFILIPFLERWCLLYLFLALVCAVQRSGTCIEAMNASMDAVWHSNSAHHNTYKVFKSQLIYWLTCARLSHISLTGVGPNSPNERHSLIDLGIASDSHLDNNYRFLCLMSSVVVRSLQYSSVVLVRIVCSFGRALSVGP